MRHAIVTCAAAGMLLVTGCAAPIESAPEPETATIVDAKPTTGTRVKGGNDARPVITIDRTVIERSGANSWRDLR